MSNSATTSYIFRFPLVHEVGYGYTEIYDARHSGTFDYLATVYDLFHSVAINESTLLEQILSSPKYMGPLNLNRFPNTKGKNAWKLIGENQNHGGELPTCKDLKGILTGSYDWSTFKKWMKVTYNTDGTSEHKFDVDYEKVRYLETWILTHKDSLPEKVAIKRLIEKNMRVSDFMDFSDLGNRNIYTQVINSCFPKEKTLELIEDLPPYSPV